MPTQDSPCWTLLRDAAAGGEEPRAECGRVGLLRLRFHDGPPIREISRLWGMDVAALHHEYARARREFLAALRDVIKSHHPGSPEVVDGECAQLLSLLE